MPTSKWLGMTFCGLSPLPDKTGASGQFDKAPTSLLFTCIVVAAGLEGCSHQRGQNQKLGKESIPLLPKLKK